MAARSGIHQMTEQLNTYATKWGILKGMVMDTTGNKIVAGLIRHGNELIADNAPADITKINDLSEKLQKKLEALFELSLSFKSLSSETRSNLYSIQEETDPTLFSIFERQLELTNKDTKEYIDHALKPLSLTLELPEGLYPIGFSKPSDEMAEAEVSEDLLPLPSPPASFDFDHSSPLDKALDHGSEGVNSLQNTPDREDVQDEISPQSFEEDREVSEHSEQSSQGELSDLEEPIEDGSSLDSTDTDEEDGLPGTTSAAVPNIFNEYFQRELPEILLEAFKGQRVQVRNAIEDLEQFEDSKLTNFVTEAAADEFYAVLAQECGVEGDPDNEDDLGALMEWGELNYSTDEAIETSLSILRQIDALLLQKYDELLVNYDQGSIRN